MKFLSSTTFVLFLLSAGSAAAFWYLNPEVLTIQNYEMQKYAPYAGWGIGVVAAAISFIFIIIFNGLRRLLKLSKKVFWKRLIIFLCVIPWLIFSWNLLGEPRFTPIARAVIDFAARPLFWGSLLTSIWALLGVMSSFIPSKK